jgi:hypothetical protein
VLEHFLARKEERDACGYFHSANKDNIRFWRRFFLDVAFGKSYQFPHQTPSSADPRAGICVWISHPEGSNTRFAKYLQVHFSIG